MNAAASRYSDLRRQVRRGMILEVAGACAGAFVAFALLSFLIDRNLRLEWPFRLAMLAGLVWFLVRQLRERWLRPVRTRLDDAEMALAVERQSPELRQSLISSLQFEAVLAGAGARDSAAMMQVVVDDVRGRLASLPFGRAIDSARVRRFGGMLAGAATVLLAWGVIDARSLGLWAARNLALSSVEWPRYTQFRFDGGNRIRMPQGDPLTLRVLVDGPVPEQVFVDYEFAGGESGSEALSATGEREFTWNLEAVLANTTLRVYGGDGLSAPYEIEVVERPRIDDLAVTVHFPEYMQREPDRIPGTEGEIRLPKGARISIDGKGHKPLRDAFLLLGEERRIPLTLAADALTFHGELAPDASTTMVVDVIDRDDLGAGQPPRLLLRLVDDKGPHVEFRPRGIGTLIAFNARIPGDLRVKDDFGVREVAAAVRVTEETRATPEGQKPAEAPFAKADVVLGDDLLPGVLRFETTGSVDLTQFNNSPDEMAETNMVRPGMLLALRWAAKDNYGPGDPHESFGEVLAVRVVTRSVLTDELRRRMVEQRQELQRIIEEEETNRVEVKDMLNPASTHEKAGMAKSRLRALSRQQAGLGRRVAFVADSYQKILWEFENNRLFEAQKVREMEAVIPVPLTGLANTEFKRSSKLVDEFAASGVEETRNNALTDYDTILERLRIVLKIMEQAETLAALLEDLRGVIKLEDRAIRDVEKAIKEESEKLFRPGKQAPPQPEKPK